MERSEVGPGGGDDTEQQVNPSSHTSPVCLPPVLCAYSNTWLCHVCCTAGVRRRQMKRQRVVSEPQQIQVSKYRKHRQLKEVFKRYPANSPSQKSKSISWWLLWYWTLNSTKTSKLPCIQFGIIIIKWAAKQQSRKWHDILKAGNKQLMPTIILQIWAAVKGLCWTAGKTSIDQNLVSPAGWTAVALC